MKPLLSRLALLSLVLTLPSCVSTPPAGEEERPKARARIVEEGAVDPSHAKLNTPTAGGAATSMADNQRSALTEMNNRMALMEREMRDLRGELEESHNTNRRLEEQVATLQQAVGGVPATPAAAPAYPTAMSTPPDAGQAVITAVPDTPPGTTLQVSPGYAPPPAPAQPAYTPPAAPAAAPLTAPVTATPPPTAPGVPSPAVVGAPQERYEAAFTLLKSGQYDRSLDAFNSFLSDHPQDDLADNAQFWIGEIYSVQKRYPDALVAFNDVLVKWPQSDKVPHSLLKIGYAFHELGDIENARKSLERLIKDFPDSAAVALAKQRLKILPQAPPPTATGR